jgi:phosphoglycolate phosphatase
MGDSAGFVVGFDLDMTLADTRQAIGAVYDTLSAETGTYVDTAAVVSRLGPPLEVEMANWFPAEEIPAMVARFRELYPSVALPATVAMPGAAAAVGAVADLGGRAMVVTAKNPRDATATVAKLELKVDVVVGSLWGEAKGRALAEHGAGIYVGDHTMDIDGARAAGALSVAVATGAFDQEALLAYGADVVLPDLLAFPDWLVAYQRSG